METNMCDGTKFQQNRPDGLDYRNFLIFKMVAVHPLGFLKVWVCDQLVSSGGLSAILQNFVKIAKLFLRYHDFFIFKMAVVRHLGSWNFWLTAILGGLICIAIQNFTKIGQTFVEISHFTIFKMAAVRHLGFLSLIFLISWCAGLGWALILFIASMI